MHQPIEQVQFVVFLKIYKCLLHQIAGKIMLLLVNNVHEKISQKVKTDFAVALHENALVFSQSEARNFFPYTLLT